MSNIVSTQAKDGSTVEFNYEDPKQGGVKDVYFAPDKSYVVAFYRKQLDYTGLLRLDKLVGKYREQIFESEGGDYWKDIFCWPEKIVDYNGKTGIVVPAYQPHFFFEAESKKGEEKEGKWFASARNYNRFVPKEEMGGLNTFLRVCLKLAQGVRRLHAAGLAHSDLSYKNCLIDPKSGSACIIDLDGPRSLPSRRVWNRRLYGAGSRGNSRSAKGKARTSFAHDRSARSRRLDISIPLPSTSPPRQKSLGF